MRASAATRPSRSPASPLGYYFLASLPGLLLIAIIFGGVRSGVFTATESSCIAVLYALLVTVLVYRELNWASFVEAMLGAVRTTAMVLLVIGTAAAFGWLMAYPAGAGAADRRACRRSRDNPIVVLLLINVVLLVLGTFMDMAPMIIICTPIFLPVVKAFGIDPVHFGVIMILNLGIGLNTPPVGTVLFVGCAVGKITVMGSDAHDLAVLRRGRRRADAGDLYSGAVAVAAARF